MSRGFVRTLLEAVRQELQRLEEPRKQPRYFMYEVVAEERGAGWLVLEYRDAPDRVLRDAQQGNGSQGVFTFRVGDVYDVPARMLAVRRGVRICFEERSLTAKGL